MFPDPNRRAVLALDGGGVRGIITLHALQALERHLGSSCFSLFNCFAGTSTGAILAGALARGYSVEALINLYREHRQDIFSRTLRSYFLGSLVTRYRKGPIRELLKEYFDDVTLAELKKDIFITATDTVRAETIYFTAFTQPDETRHGTYKGLRLRDAIEASLSAPTYFPPHGRFIDGGVGVHNNPAYVAAVEALRYSSPRQEHGVYREEDEDRKPNVVSFGTGAQPQLMEPGQAARTSVLGWLGYVVGEGMLQASSQQSYVARSELHGMEKAIRFYRYQLHLSHAEESKNFISNTLGCSIPADLNLDELTLDATDEERFDFLDDLGQAWGAYLTKEGFFLRQDQDGVLKEDGRRELQDPDSYFGEIFEELAADE